MDLPCLRDHMFEAASKFISTTPESRSTEENWSLFKDDLKSGVDTYVPS